MSFMTRRQIDAWTPEPRLERPAAALTEARWAVDRAGLGGASQQMGRRWAVGCIALEITQRCNLDCTLCYLSEHSEATRDLPLEELFRRIDDIAQRYGSNTDVQITGGDPTLRARPELVAIVERTARRGLRPTLMTNGIRATRSLLSELAAHGLVDVVFHVDTTQRRKGYETEQRLNDVRAEYLARARGLGLSVMFNTTVHDGNFDAVPDLVRFFRAHAGEIRTASFQLHADTGRGVAGARDSRVTPANVWAQLERGAGTTLNHAASRIGHPSCNRYALCFAVNGRLFDAFADGALAARVQDAFADLPLPRNDRRAFIARGLRRLVRHPAHALLVTRWLGERIWAMRGELARWGGRVSTLSLVIHNFMDAAGLEEDRVRLCAFKVMTPDGPLSMCLYNAKRDHFILQPVTVARDGVISIWNPLRSETAAGVVPDPAMHPLKHLKGRARARRLAEHRNCDRRM